MARRPSNTRPAQPERADLYREITPINGQIGLMRRDLRLWLHEASPAGGGRS